MVIPFLRSCSLTFSFAFFISFVFRFFPFLLPQPLPAATREAMVGPCFNKQTSTTTSRCYFLSPFCISFLPCFNKHHLNFQKIRLLQFLLDCRLEKDDRRRMIDGGVMSAEGAPRTRVFLHFSVIPQSSYVFSSRQ